MAANLLCVVAQQVIIRGFMAADEATSSSAVLDAGEGVQGDALPGQAAAGSTRISMRSSQTLSENA